MVEVTPLPLTASAILIGDELLSGSVREANLGNIASMFGNRGIELVEVRIVPDDVERIVGALRALHDQYAYVVTTGGLGSTHDDVAVDAVAHAFDAQLEENEAILERMRVFWGEEPNEARRRMARIPVGAQLLEGPPDSLPGFAFDNVFVLPGVPHVVEVMLKDVSWRLTGGPVILTRTIAAEGCEESALAQPLKAVAGAHPTVAFGSYPFPRRYGAKLVLRGRDSAEMDEAVRHLLSALDRAGIAAFETTAPHGGDTGRGG